MRIFDAVKGKKTYLIGFGYVLWGAYLFATTGDAATATEKIGEGLAFMALRAGVSKAGTGAGAGGGK